MTRFPATLTITAAILAFTGCDGAQPTNLGGAPDGTEPHLSLSGSSATAFVTTGGADITLVVDAFEERWSFEVKRKKDLTATGEFQFTANIFGSLVTAHGDVTCFAVEGNRARLGGVITQSNTFAPGTPFIWSVEDNGEGSNNTPDRASPAKFGLATAPVENFCSAAGTYLDMEPIETGNVQVHH